MISVSWSVDLVKIAGSTKAVVVCSKVPYLGTVSMLIRDLDALWDILYILIDTIIDSGSITVTLKYIKIWHSNKNLKSLESCDEINTNIMEELEI